MVREGKALVYIPDPEEARASGRLEPAWLPVFYNPVMEFNRDISVVALQAYMEGLAPRSPIIAVEPLTATGVRAVRYSLEVDGLEAVHAGDIDGMAVALARTNVSLNGVEGRVKVHHADARELIFRLRREGVPVLFVDIDPFGTPAPFIESAIAVIGRGGLLAVTATDLAVLEGGKPATARRRYGVRVRKIAPSKEVAVRALIAFIAMKAAMYDKAVRPLLSYYADHYVRLYLAVERGAGRADRMLERDIGCIVYDERLGTARLEKSDCRDPGALYPMWASSIFDEAFVAKCFRLLESRYRYLGTYKRSYKFLKTLLEESRVGGEFIHHRIDSIASKARVNMPPASLILEELERRGFRASRTVFTPIGIRTNAGEEFLVEIVRGLSQERVRANPRGYSEGS